MGNMDIYNEIRTVPNGAQKTISAGRLKGMTDINPMWRIQTLTEKFGIVGMGWYYKIVKQWVEDGADGTRCAFVDIELYIKIDDKWSEPIMGTGGSMLVAKEKSGLYTSDEAYKMALTDAISVACKALGMGADIYWAAGRSKYNQKPDNKLPFPEADEKISDDKVKQLDGILTIFPKENREIITKLLLNQYKAKEFKELTVSQFVKVRNDLLDRANKIKDERLNNMIKHFATKSGKGEGEAKLIIETVLNKNIDDITIAEFHSCAMQVNQMIDDLGIDNE